MPLSSPKGEKGRETANSIFYGTSVSIKRIILSVALLLAKKDSHRLPNKNTEDFKGLPMFVVNLRKCRKIFSKVYVSSNCDEILERAEAEGAIPIKRGDELCGDTPNIPVYQHALKHIKDDIVAVQVNSPTINPLLIKTIKVLIEFFDEVMTCHSDYSIYGSVWAIKKNKLKEYKDFYNPSPKILLVDESVDIHTPGDLLLAKKQV